MYPSDERRPADKIFRPRRPVWPRWRSGLLLTVALLLVGKLILPPEVLHPAERPSLGLQESRALQEEVQRVVNRAVNDPDYTPAECADDHWRLVDRWETLEKRYDISLDVIRGPLAVLRNQVVSNQMQQALAVVEIPLADEAMPDRAEIERAVDSALYAARTSHKEGSKDPDWGAIAGFCGRMYLIGLIIAVPLLLLRPFEAVRTRRDGWALLRATWEDLVASAVTYPISFNAYWPELPVLCQLVNRLARERGSQVTAYLKESGRFDRPDCPIWQQAYKEVFYPTSVRARQQALGLMWRDWLAGWARPVHPVVVKPPAENRFVNLWQQVSGLVARLNAKLGCQQRQAGRLAMATVQVTVLLPLCLWQVAAAGGETTAERQVVKGTYLSFSDRFGDDKPPGLTLGCWGDRWSGWLSGATGPDPNLELDLQFGAIGSDGASLSWGPFADYGLNSHTWHAGLTGFGTVPLLGGRLFGPWYLSLDAQRDFAPSLILPNLRQYWAVGDVQLGLAGKLAVTTDGWPTCWLGPGAQIKLGERGESLRLRWLLDATRRDKETQFQAEFSCPL